MQKRKIGAVGTTRVYSKQILSAFFPQTLEIDLCAQVFVLLYISFHHDIDSAVPAGRASIARAVSSHLRAYEVALVWLVALVARPLWNGKPLADGEH